MFIFRNNTIENLFEDGTQYSGYGDVSYIPQDEKEFVWFYQVPISFEPENQLHEVEGMADKLNLIVKGLPMEATLTIVSLENLFPITYVESDRRLEEAVDNFNGVAAGMAAENVRIRFVDFSRFISRYSIEEVINWKFFFISQMILSPMLVPAFKEWWSREMDIFRGVRKKCLVLDLDNTLWGGVLGEDGIAGIKIGGDYPGKAFLYFQEALLELSKQGVILTVCSKNNETDVKEVWEKNPFMILTGKHFSAWQINWENKADNIRRLADILNIGLDSMVFIDDNPTERELVRQQLPMVAVPEFPKRAYDIPVFIKKLVDDYFQTYSLTEEDRKKTEQYKANARRAQEQTHFSDITDFIKSLDIELNIKPADEFILPRLAQMTQKTNQFNLTTHRYTEADIESIIDEGGMAYGLAAKDKYGDNGVTGEIILRRNKDKGEIDSLLLSCRILGKRIEDAFVLTVLGMLKKEGIKIVEARYIPSAKNGQVAEFYDRLGFTCVSTAGDGTKEYSLNLEELRNPENIYRITIE